MAWLKRRGIERVRALDGDRLLSDLTEQETGSSPLDEVTRASAVAELNLRLADVAFELETSPSTFAALTRISLASGVGLALISALSGPALASPALSALRVGSVACVGFIGAIVVAAFGRAAKGRSAQIRQQWDDVSRVVGKALGTTLAATSKTRGSSFPE